MYFPSKFTRIVTAGPTLWTQDTVPSGAMASGTDNGISIRVRDQVGWPAHRLAVAYTGPTGAAPYMPADLYAWDANSQAWYKVHEATKSLRLGRLVYFDLVGLAEPPVLKANLDTATVGGVDLLLIVTPPPTAAFSPPLGNYVFSMGADLTSLGTEEPNPDDEANGVQAVTPSDGANLPFGPCRYLWVTATGNVKLACVDDADAGAVTLTGVAANSKLPFKARKVFATGTTATVVAVY